MNILLFCVLPLVALLLLAIYSMMNVAASSDRQMEAIMEAMIAEKARKLESEHTADCPTRLIPGCKICNCNKYLINLAQQDKLD